MTSGSVSGNCRRRAGLPSPRYTRLCTGSGHRTVHTACDCPALRLLYRTTEGEFIGLIVARSVLDTIEEKTQRSTQSVYGSVNTLSIHGGCDCCRRKAEREGAVAVVCAPILSSVIEQLVRIPSQPSSPRVGAAGNRARGTEGVDLISILPISKQKYGDDECGQML